MSIYFLVDWCRFSLSARVEIELRVSYERSEQLGHWARNLCLFLTASLPFLQYIANREVWSLIFLMKTTSAVARTSSRGTAMKMQSDGTDLGWQIGPSPLMPRLCLCLAYFWPGCSLHLPPTNLLSNLGPRVFFYKVLAAFHCETQEIILHEKYLQEGKRLCSSVHTTCAYLSPSLPPPDMRISSFLPHYCFLVSFKPVTPNSPQPVPPYSSPSQPQALFKGHCRPAALTDRLVPGLVLSTSPSPPPLHLLNALELPSRWCKIPFTLWKRHSGCVLKSYRQWLLPCSQGINKFTSSTSTTRYLHHIICKAHGWRDYERSVFLCC